MFKVFLFVALCFLCSFRLIGQKPAIDSSVLGKWPRLNAIVISPDGKYSAYIVNNGFTRNNMLHLVLNSTGKGIVFEGVSSCKFSNDSRLLLFLTKGDTLGLYSLPDKRCVFISQVNSFMIPENGIGELFSYRRGEKLVIANGERQIRKFEGISNSYFSKDGKILFLETRENDTSKMMKLDCFNTGTSDLRTIWRGSAVEQYTFDEKNYQLVFISRNSFDVDGGYSLYHYNGHMSKAECLLKSGTFFGGGQFKLMNSHPILSKNGDRILFEMAGIDEPQHHARVSGDSDLLLWSYKEPYHQTLEMSLQYKEVMEGRSYATLDIKSGRVFLLNTRGMEILEKSESFDKYLLFGEPAYPKEYEPREYRPAVYLISTKDSTRRFIGRRRYYEYLQLSPDEKYVCWFDPDNLSYFSMATATGIRHNLSLMVPASLYNEGTALIGPHDVNYGRPKWFGGHTLFLYDRFDIWKVDLDKDLSPLNITNAYGKVHQLIFNLADSYDGKIISDSGKTLLTCFDPNTKQNGFWWARGNSRDPEKCTMGDYSYVIGRTNPIGTSWTADGFPPVKARTSNRYIVMRRDAQEFPNIFFTEDFKAYTPISDVHPEKRYNWMRSELITWKMTDGKLSQGVLYKPENFDAKRKYPLIFYIYEKQSNTLNNYLEPDYSGGPINIPYFVSNDYLLFLPDIYYERGHNGKGVMSAIESAINYLGQFSWIDTNRLGIQGGSFGGWEVNFVVTHTKKFAAACEMSGMSDLVSFYDAVEGNFDRQESLETTGQAIPFGFQVTPWTHPELYVENSPVFFAQAASTPLLIGHGDMDGNVPFSQGTEMFQALKRAGKVVWLLQYHEAGHGLTKMIDRVDYTIRMKQFFDHYLKDAPIPRWMAVGLPAYLRGTDGGFEFDTSQIRP